MPAPRTSPVSRRQSVSQSSHARLKIRLLATSDLHAHVLAWDYCADCVSENCGLARTGMLISQARAEAANCLLLDNGDFLNGNPLGDHVAETFNQSGWPGHPIITAMNWLGYDAATLGNHDFSAGIALLQACLGRAKFPVVSANIHAKATAAASVARAMPPPYVILERRFRDEAGQLHNLKVGVIGFLPPQTVNWEQCHLQADFVTTDIVATARALIPELQAAGADLVIALSHSGAGDGCALAGAENASRALAGLDGIDAVIAGHTHQVYPVNAPDPQDAGKPLVMPGFFGSHLGVIDLTLARRANGWQMASHHCETRPIARRDAQTGRLLPLVASQPEIEDAARSSHEALLHKAAATIGQTRVQLHSYFALIAPAAALHLVADAQTAYLRRAFAETPHAGIPLLSAVAPFKAGGRGGPENYTVVPQGLLTSRHAADLYIHPNHIVALQMTGADIALWLERAVSLFHQVSPGARDAPLIDPDFPAFNFDMIYGLTYQVDLAAPPCFDSRGAMIRLPAGRIVNLCHLGKPIGRDSRFIVATNSYRSSGGSGFAATTPDRVIHRGHIAMRELLQRHIAALGTIAPVPQVGWSLRRMPGTSVVFDSAPLAANHLDGAPDLKIEAGNLQPNGFRRFRLHL